MSNWRGFGRLSRESIASKARPAWICTNCQRWSDGAYDQRLGRVAPPRQCEGCGRLQFDYFQSQGEAKCWLRLKLLERQGEISELERQIRIPLLAYNLATNSPVEFATFVLDFRYREREGQRVNLEYKPRSGMSYDALLKIKAAESMGIPITLSTS